MNDDSSSVKKPIETPSLNNKHTGIITWFASNPVASNLLMIVIFILGAHSASTIQRNMSPDLELKIINISMIYPGAAPEEVEKGIILKIEESLRDIEAIKKTESTAQESLAKLTLTIYDGFDVLTALDEVKSAVDAISSFPEQSEKPVITRIQRSHHVLNIQLYGNLNEREMKDLAEQSKAELLQNPDIAHIVISGTREFEIAIEVSEFTLRKYNLTLDHIAQVIRNSSIDLPGGSIKTENGEIMLRSKGQAYQQHDFEQIVLLTQPDGTRLTLGDIANIKDGFVETQGFSLFDNKYSVVLTLYAVGKQDIITVAEAGKRYVKEKQLRLPEGVNIDYWADITYYLEGRLTMMLENLALGALLVFTILALFLNIKLAFWVMAGLPVCFLGAFIFMPLEGIEVTLNMISLFGFLLILGIVVDDAIIIGESAYSSIEKNGHSLDAVISGTQRVATPATFGVLTTIVAFSPTLFTEGAFAAMPAAIGWVVTLCLVFSLIESKWILPSHLAHTNLTPQGIWKQLDKIPKSNNRRLSAFVSNHYRPFLMKCIRHRYTTAASFIALLILVAGLVAGGLVRYILIPSLPGNFIKSELEMVEGSTEWQTSAAQKQIANALYQVEENYIEKTNDETGLVHHYFSWGHSNRFSNSTLELTKAETRSMSSNDIADQWRRLVGDIPGAKILAISNMDGPGGPGLAFKLIGKDIEQLKNIAKDLEEKIASYDGVYDIRNSATDTQDEIILSIKPSAEALGLTLSDLGRQVRHAFYGAEAQRLQRGLHEIKVMVRYPKSERDTLSHLENMFIRTADGQQVPFNSVAEVVIAPSYSKTTRIDSERAIKVTAEVDKSIAEPGSIIKDIEQHFMPHYLEQYSDFNYKMDGESEETDKLFSSLFSGLAAALLGIYALLAIPLKSYLQPLIIMAVIPFGIIGAIIGHLVVGIAFDMMSFFGIIALSGVVVNDSLIMVDFVNTETAKGIDKYTAILNSGQQRFRAILITSLTTFFGLLPILLESSVQAKHILPMAVSLSFGIIFSTVITLILVPCMYMILEDFSLNKNKASPSINQ